MSQIDEEEFPAIIAGIEWFRPERVYLFEHEGQRWFTDSYSMLPVRQFPASLPDSLGRHVLEEDEEMFAEYVPVEKKWDPKAAVERLGHGCPRNTDRRDSQLFMFPDDRDPLVFIYERNAGALLNRLYLDVAQFITQRVIDGFGVGGPEVQVTLYSGDERVGFIMPVRASKMVGSLIPLAVA